MGPLHRLQFIRNKLLQHWSPGGHRSCRVPASVWILYGLQLPSGHIHIFHRELFIGCRVIIAPLVSSMGCSRAISSPESAQAAGDSSLWRMERILLLPLHWPGCLHSHFSIIFYSLCHSCCLVYFTLSKICCQRCACNCWEPQQLCFGDGWNRLCLAIDVFSQEYVRSLQPSLTTNSCHVKLVWEFLIFTEISK